MTAPEQTAALRQATCVALGGPSDSPLERRAILIEGSPGSGKSSLALALIDRGAVLVGDDGVNLEVRGAALWASPPPNIAGRLEIRSVGLVEMPVTSAPVALILMLDQDAPRYIEEPANAEILGVAIPSLAFLAHSPVAAIRAEYALRQHGLPGRGNA